MRKALYFHGFLGSHEDMRPLYLDGYKCDAFNLRTLLFKKDYIKELSKSIKKYDFIVGYSFGGRILKELKRFFPEKSKKWIFVSSRHTPYSKTEVLLRESFRQKLFLKLEDRAEFFNYWKKLSLFSGHQMDEYRAKYKLGYTPWTVDEIKRYLEFFFTSSQFKPQKCDKSIFVHGVDDEKYSKEGRGLKEIFNVYPLPGGHRCLFEHPDQFKIFLKKVLL